MFFNNFWAFGSLSMITGLLYKVFLAIAVYKDATERKDKNAVIWTVIVILFGIIPTIIYAFVRYQKEKELTTCQHCGNLVSKKYPICMYCKQPIGNETKDKIISEEVKKYLIIAGVLFLANKLFILTSSLLNVGNLGNMNFYF